MISSHVVYKLRTNADGSLRLKARLVLHGSRDAEKENLRNDSALADMLLTRLILALGVLLGF